MDLSNIIEWVLVPLFGWNMWMTNRCQVKIEIMEKETKDLKETERKVIELDKDQSNLFESLGGIKHDIHDIRNFLMKVANPEYGPK